MGTGRHRAALNFSRSNWFRKTRYRIGFKIERLWKSVAGTSVTGKALDRMLGHESVTAGIAGPEIADEIVGKIGGSFRGYHRVRTHRAGRQLTSTGVTVR